MAVSWWRRECIRFDVDPDDPGIALDEFPGTVATAAAGEWRLDELPVGGDGASALGVAYLDSLAPSLKSQEGRYYTPRVLAGRLVDQAWALAPRAHGGMVMDPACGAGALLAAATERMASGLPPDEALAWTARQLKGRDLDPVAVWLCNIAVKAALLPAWRQIPEAERGALPSVASVGDGLHDDRPASLILTNPPFGRVRLTSVERRRFARALYGHANRATLFLDDALRRLEGPGSAAAFVLPASVVGGAYFQRLRSLLAEHAPPAWLAFVADREGVFPGEVLQESVLGVFVKGSTAAAIESERIVVNGGVAWDGLGALPLPARPHEPWLLPRRPDDGAILSLAAGYSMRLDDYGWKVSTGPLVWNRHRDQLSSEPGPGRLPVVWAQDIRGGRIDPSERRPARWCHPHEGQDWLVLNRPAVLVQRTTAPEQRRRIVTALLDRATLAQLGGRVVVENHLNVCTWNGEGPVDHARLVRFLSSEEADRLYRCLTGSVAVSAFELRALPLPTPSDWEDGRFPGASQ